MRSAVKALALEGVLYADKIQATIRADCPL